MMTYGQVSMAWMSNNILHNVLWDVVIKSSWSEVTLGFWFVSVMSTTAAMILASH